MKRANGDSDTARGNTLQTVERAAKVIKALAPTNGADEFTLMELCGAIGLPGPTVYRILNTLVQEGLVDRRGKHYRLGHVLLQLGLMKWERLDLRKIARPVMEQLAEELQNSIYLTVRRGLTGIFIDRVESSARVRLVEPLGAPLPLHVGASKQTLLAFQADRDEIVRQLHKQYKNIDVDALLAELDRIAERGYGVSHSAVTPESGGVAVPIMNHEGVAIASMSVGGPKSAFIEPDRIEFFAARLKEASEKISGELGYHPSFVL